MQTPGRFRPLALVAALVLTATAFAETSPPPPPKGTTRVTALARAVRFNVPGSPAKATLCPGASVVLTAATPADPARVQVEEGVVLVNVPPGAPNLVKLMGSLHGLLVKTGTSVYIRHGLVGDENGLAVDGEAEIPTGAKSIPLPKDQVLHATPAGSLLGGVEPAVAEAAKSAVAYAGAKDGSAVDVPDSALPLPGKRPEAKVGEVTVIPLAGGTTVSSVSERPTLATDQITELRQRLIIGARDEQLGGYGFMVDFVPARAGRVRNVISAGARCFVRFFYSPRWLVTLGPGAVLDAEGPDRNSADRSPSQIHLLQGAMMIQGKGSSLPDGVSLQDLATELGEKESGQPGVREIVTAARRPGEGKVPAEILLARAREAMRPLVALPLGANVLVAPPPGAPPPPAGSPPPRPRGVAPVVALTLLSDIPAGPEFISRYVPLHVASTDPIDRIALSMFAAAPQSDMAVGALVQVSPGKVPPIPAALLMPRSFEDSMGPTPKPFGAFVTAQKADLWTLRRQADESMSRVGLHQDATDDFAPGGQKIDAKSLLLVVFGIIVLSVPGVRLRLLQFLELIPGFSRLKCRRCGMVLDKYPIGEFAIDEDHEPLAELLRYDGIMEIVRQEKARSRVMDRITMKDARPVGASKFRMAGSWCQRCLSGSIFAEIYNHGYVIDEFDWEVSNADTHKLMRMIQNPAKAQAIQEEGH